MPTHDLNTEDLEQSIQVLRDLIRRGPAREGRAMVKTFLIDGPIMTAPARRAAFVGKMAVDLVKAGAALGDRSDCIRELFRTGAYHSVDIALLADDARQVAAQELVAKEVSDG